MTLLVSGATLIDGTGTPPVPQAAVLIEGDRIVAVGREREFGSRQITERIDAAGTYLIPGLIDAHVHLRRHPQDTAPLYLEHGVTTVRETGSTLELMRERRAVFDARIVPAPRAFFSGPILDVPPVVHPQITAPVDTIAAAQLAVDELAAAGVDAIKIYVGVPAPMTAAIVARARTHGLRCIGDLDATSASEAITAGIWSLEHATVVFRDVVPPALQPPASDRGRLGREGWHDRRERILAQLDPAGPAVRAIARRIVESEVFFDPTLIVFDRSRQANDPRTAALPDVRRMPQLVQDDWWRETLWRRELPSDVRATADRAFETLVAIVTEIISAGAKVLVGSDACNAYVVPGASLHQELALLVRAGLTPAAAIHAATEVNAEALERSADIGTIAPGKLADLALLGQDPLHDIRNVSSIVRVIQRGATVFQRDAGHAW